MPSTAARHKTTAALRMKTTKQHTHAMICHWTASDKLSIMSCKPRARKTCAYKATKSVYRKTKNAFTEPISTRPFKGSLGEQEKFKYNKPGSFKNRKHYKNKLTAWNPKTHIITHICNDDEVNQPKQHATTLRSTGTPQKSTTATCFRNIYVGKTERTRQTMQPACDCSLVLR